MTTISTEELAAVHSSAHNKTIDCLETLLNEIVSKRSIQVCDLVRENNSLHARISELERIMKVKDEALRDLLNHGCSFPHPITGEEMQHQANPTAAEEALALQPEK